MAILGLNVGGITCKFRYGILSEYIKKFGIVLFSETKLFRIPQLEFPDYDIFSFKQKTNLHGLSILIKSGLFSYSQKLCGKSKCVMWILLGSSETSLNFIIGAVYIPGYNSKFSDQNDFDIISEDILVFRDKYNLPFVLMGDFNSRTSNLNPTNNPPAHMRRSKDTKVDTYGRNLIKMCSDLNLTIVNGSHGSDANSGNFTCHKKKRNDIFESVVDYCIVSNTILPHISDFYVDIFDRNLSDVHSPLCLDLKGIPIVKSIPITENQNFEKILYKSTWKPELQSQYQNSFSDDKIFGIEEKILDLERSPTISDEDIKLLVTDITAVIVEPAQQVGMCKKIRPKKARARKSPNKTWFNSECEEKRKNFFSAKNERRKAKTTEEKAQCNQKMDELGKEYKQFISSHQKEFTRELHKNLRQLHRHHPKEYWSILKKSEGTSKSEPKIPLSDFEKHFKNLSQGNTNSSHIFDPGEIDPTNFQEFNLDFTLEEVKSNIKSLNSNKSEGYDYIKTEYLKNCPPKMIELFVKLFNLILRSGHVPHEWSVGLIVPIYKKKGSKLDPNNYRGITLLSCLGKLFTACINVRLTKFVTERSIIGEEQAAFRENYSTTDHVFFLNELINMYIHKKKHLYCCFIDYEKAFDRINRSALWNKVISSGINGKLLRVVYNMYEIAKSCVKENSMISGFFSCNMGVRQGENLSPLLFAIFLNDFESSLSGKYEGLPTFEDMSTILSSDEIEYFINMYTLLYADDTLVFAESPEQMQLALDEIGKYCKKWDLSINKKKTKVVIFGTDIPQTQHNFTIGHLDIGTEKEYCYLGVVFNFNGNFSKAINERITPARKAMFGLNSKAVNLLLPPDIHIDLFEKMVTPIFLYGCEVWGYGNIEPIEIFYRKFIRRSLGVGKSTANCIVYGEVGKYPIFHKVNARMLSFWVKITEGKATKLSSIMYKIIYKLHLEGLYDSPWLMHIKSILLNSGRPQFWYQQDFLTPKAFMVTDVCLQLKAQYLAWWEAELYRNRKCVSYRIFKDQIIFEPYLKNLNFLDRRALCMFRVGNHGLPVEKSRYTAGGGGVDVICKLCNRGDICDEFHVLFLCPHFNDQRAKYLNKSYSERPSTLKMYTLFNSGQNKTQKLAKFVRCILKQFKKYPFT